MLVVAIEVTEPLDDVWLLVGDVVVYPHPPARVEAGDGGREVLQQLGVSGSRAVAGAAVVVVPGARGPPGRVVGVAQDVLATPQGAGVVVTAGGSHVAAVSKREIRH